MDYQRQKYILVVLDKETGIKDYIDYLSSKTEAYRLKSEYNRKETNQHLSYEVWLNEFYEEVYY